MTEPTPGLWEVTTGPGTSYFGVGSIDTGENIGVAMSEANARFIAAAPETLEQRNELLAALERVIANGCIPKHWSTYGIACAAIAKAKGGS